MRIVPKKTRKSKKVVEIQSPSFLMMLGILIMFPFRIIGFLYNLLIRFPSEESCLLGFFRLVFWGSLFYFYGISLESEWFITLLTLVMSFLSFLAMIGVYDGMAVYSKDPGPYPGITHTMDQIESRLNNSTERKKFLKNFFGD